MWSYFWAPWALRGYPTWVGGPLSTPCGYKQVHFSIVYSNENANAWEVMWDDPVFHNEKKMRFEAFIMELEIKLCLGKFERKINWVPRLDCLPCHALMSSVSNVKYSTVQSDLLYLVPTFKSSGSCSPKEWLTMQESKLMLIIHLEAKLTSMGALATSLWWRTPRCTFPLKGPELPTRWTSGNHWCALALQSARDQACWICIGLITKLTSRDIMVYSNKRNVYEKTHRKSNLSCGFSYESFL